MLSRALVSFLNWTAAEVQRKRPPWSAGLLDLPTAALSCLSTNVFLSHVRFLEMGDQPANDDAATGRKTKVCFVTVGATAPFDALIKAIFEPKFLQALHDAGFTLLRIQHGHEGQDGFFQRLAGQPAVLDICENCKIDISGFGFNKDGLDAEIRAAKGIGGREAKQVDMVEGAVISHAGKGTWRLSRGDEF